jgi:hypothetical protein
VRRNVEVGCGSVGGGVLSLKTPNP